MHIFYSNISGIAKMCKGPMQAFLQALPKCEQHLYLEGTLEPALLFELAADHGIRLPSTESDPAFASVDSLLESYAVLSALEDFSRYYLVNMSVLFTAGSFEA